MQHLKFQTLRTSVMMMESQHITECVLISALFTPEAHRGCDLQPKQLLQ